VRILVSLMILCAVGVAQQPTLGSLEGEQQKKDQSKKSKYAPLPKQILAGKKVFLLNLSDRPRVLDDAYKTLSKWGRYEIVAERGDADLILAFTTEVTGERTREIVFGRDTITTQPTYSGTISTINRAPRVHVKDKDEDGLTTLRIFDAHAENPSDTPPIWAVTVPWSARGSGRDVIEELKKRVKEQQKN
jgi:hypothetical protein